MGNTTFCGKKMSKAGVVLLVFLTSLLLLSCSPQLDDDSIDENDSLVDGGTENQSSTGRGGASEAKGTVFYTYEEGEAVVEVRNYSVTKYQASIKNGSGAGLHTATTDTASGSEPTEESVKNDSSSPVYQHNVSFVFHVVELQNFNKPVLSEGDNIRFEKVGVREEELPEFEEGDRVDVLLFLRGTERMFKEGHKNNQWFYKVKSVE